MERALVTGVYPNRIPLSRSAPGTDNQVVAFWVLGVGSSDG